MLFLNLVPPEQRESEPLPHSIDQHPFFRSLLGISGPGGNPIVGKVADSDLASQAAFLTTAAQAHSAFLIAAPLAYRRVAELSTASEVCAVAQKAFDIETGRHGQGQAPGTGPEMSRLEQFLNRIESLLPGLELVRPDADDFAIHDSLKINQASLPEALALCEEFENARVGMTLAWQDFISQWQVFLGIRTEKLDRQFLGECTTLAGDLLTPSLELRGKAEYLRVREQVRREFVRHFDQATWEILTRLQ